MIATTGGGGALVGFVTARTETVVTTIIPPELRSTVDLLRRAFPAGWADEDEYAAVLELLYPHLSDRQLASAVAAFVGRPYEGVLNDVYRAGAGGWASAAARAAARQKLEGAGLDTWTREE